MSSAQVSKRETRKRRNSIGIIAIAILMSATTAQAWIEEDDEVFNRNGGSASFNGLVALETFSGNGTKDIQSAGIQVRLGYRFDPRLSAEAQFEWANGWTVKDGSNLDHFVTGSVNLKGYLLQNFFQPYLLVGMGATHIRVVDSAMNTESNTRLSFRFGAGADLYINETLGLNLEYTMLQATGRLDDFRYQALGIGFFLRF